MTQVEVRQSITISKGKRPLPDSNRGWRICNPLPEHADDDANHLADKQVTARASAAAGRGCTPGCTDDPDLSRVVTAWPSLAEPIRRAILALIGPALLLAALLLLPLDPVQACAMAVPVGAARGGCDTACRY